MLDFNNGDSIILIASVSGSITNKVIVSHLYPLISWEVK